MSLTPNRQASEQQARAMITWGDTRESVIAYLKLQGFGDKDSFELVNVLIAERNSDIRKTGVKKTVFGVICLVIAVSLAVLFWKSGMMRVDSRHTVKIYIIPIMLALYGFWKLTDGLIMFIFPKSEKSSLSEHGEL